MSSSALLLASFERLETRLHILQSSALIILFRGVCECVVCGGGCVWGGGCVGGIKGRMSP